MLLSHLTQKVLILIVILLLIGKNRVRLRVSLPTGR